jgi:hypothetical protein
MAVPENEKAEIAKGLSSSASLGGTVHFKNDNCIKTV